MNDTLPIYNLKAVIKETGLSPATLRAWERRYGLIKPDRSPGGHRLYSRLDIELIKWLIERQKEGLSISQAVGMWKVQQEGVYGEPLHRVTSKVISPSPNGMLDELREQWVAACRSFDDVGANQALDQAFSITAPETVCFEIFQKGLVEIGRDWYAGKVSVQQEHFASAIATRRLNTLFTALTVPTRPETILAACPSGEEHEFILLMITYLLRRQGWNALFLGANVPLEDLDQTIKSTKPAMVLSAAQTLTGAASLSELSQYLHSLDIPLAYGGGIFTNTPATERRISGYYLGDHLYELPGMIERLVIAPPDLPEAQSLLPEYFLTLEGFKQYESAILASSASAMQVPSIDRYNVELAGGYLTRLIESAIYLGDIHFLDGTIDWLDGLLSSRGISGSQVKQFYRSYRQAVARELGVQGKLIVEWLEIVESRIS